MERRSIEYISPTSLDAFDKQTEEFYLQRIAPIKIERIPQTHPMSIGAGFDAFVKSYLVNKFIDHEDQAGNALIVRPQTIEVFNEDTGIWETVSLLNEEEQRAALLVEFNVESIFKKQVEKQNQEWAWMNAEFVFERYKLSGALTELTTLIIQAFEVSFESTIQRNIAVNGYDIPFLGKPDVQFKVLPSGITIMDIDADNFRAMLVDVLLDWKVNGYCGKSNTSPKPGFVICRDGWSVMDKKMSRSHNKMHKKAQCMMFHDMAVNIASFFERTDKTWANQLSIYGWLCGIPVGQPFIAWVDQIVAKPAGSFPDLRIATHRAKISTEWQMDLWNRAKIMWQALLDGHYFLDLTLEESEERATTLDKQFEGLKEAPDWFKDMTRKDDYRG